jgi:cullin 4
MANIFTLLSLPKTSNAFTDTKSTILGFDDGKASPRRKTPRLDADSDSASASRPPKPFHGSIKIQIIGDERMLLYILFNGAI